MDWLHALSAAHPVLTTIAYGLACWCAASVLLAVIWAACLPEIRYVPQAPGLDSERRRIS